MRKDYVQKSRDYVLDNFSKVEMTKKIMKVYQDLTRE